MTQPESTATRLRELLDQIRECSSKIDATRDISDGVDAAVMMKRISEIGSAAHSLWPSGEENDGERFEEIMKLKADVQNEVVRCREALAQ